LEPSKNTNEKFEPFISAGESIKEVTWKAVILGSLISVLFGVASRRGDIHGGAQALFQKSNRS